MIADAHIIVTEIRDFRGNLERLEWDWQGGKVAGISIDFLSVAERSKLDVENLREGDVFSLGPFRLLVVDYNLMREQLLVMQTGHMARLRLHIHKATRWVDQAYRRLILMACIWGLAKYNPYTVPTWRDVYFLNRIFGRKDAFKAAAERINKSLRDEPG